MKICCKCKELKSFSEYHKHKHSNDGVKHACKVCRNAENSAYRKANPEKVKASLSSWKERNPELSKERLKQWRLANLEKAKARSLAFYVGHADEIKAKARAWYANNPEKAKARARLDYERNPESYKMRAKNRRAKIKNSGGKLSKNIREKLFKLQKGKCACCKLPLGDSYHLDHIVPLAKGGPNTDDNVQLLRAKCNLQKTTKHPVDFMQERGYLL